MQYCFQKYAKKLLVIEYLQGGDMENQFKWFLKTHLQHEMLHHYRQPSPTPDEANEAICAIGMHFPHLDGESVANRLHLILKEVSDKRIVPALTYQEVLRINDELNLRFSTVDLHSTLAQQTEIKKEEDLLKKVIHSPSNRRVKPLLKKFWVNNTPTPIFKSQYEKERYKVKQVIIEAYIKKGYGMNNFREHVKAINFTTKVDYRRYAINVTSLVTEAFRALEKFLETNIGIIVEQFARPDIRILYAILLNFRDLSPNEQCFNVYTVFLKSIYDLLAISVELPAQNAYKTYQAILKLLMIRQKEVDPLRSDEKEKISMFKIDKQKIFCKKSTVTSTFPQRSIDLPASAKINGSKSTIKPWDNEFIDELAHFYIQQQELGAIRKRYREIYGHITMFESVETLRSEIYKIIRKSLRKVQKQVKVYASRFSEDVLNLISLKQDERYVQYVLTSPQFAEVRKLLCKFHLQKEKDFELIEEIAKSLKAGIKARLASTRPIIGSI